MAQSDRGSSYLDIGAHVNLQQPMMLITERGNVHRVGNDCVIAEPVLDLGVVWVGWRRQRGGLQRAAVTPRHGRQHAEDDRENNDHPHRRRQIDRSTIAEPFAPRKTSPERLSLFTPASRNSLPKTSRNDGSRHLVRYNAAVARPIEFWSYHAIQKY